MRTESERPSSWRVGGGNEGGGVADLSGGGEEEREWVSEMWVCAEAGGGSSGIVFLGMAGNVFSRR